MQGAFAKRTVAMLVAFPNGPLNGLIGDQALQET
jgi:hypothetical protein